MNYKNILITGCVFAGIGVAVGAFGAHGLKDLLMANNRTETFELAVRYQFYHAFGILTAGLLMRGAPSRSFSWAAACFAIGILFFSGSQFALSLTDVRAFGAITPIGGLLFIAGWGMLVVGLVRQRA